MHLEARQTKCEKRYFSVAVGCNPNVILLGMATCDIWYPQSPRAFG